MRNRSVKEILRSQTAAPVAGNTALKTDAAPGEMAAKLKLAIDNVKPVLSLAPRKPGNPIVVPVAMRTLRDGDLEYIQMRPSEFVANIAGPPGVGYQRPPTKRMPKLRSIAHKFDPRLLGLLHVWVNESGQRECLDGLGRLFVCLHLLRPVYDEPVLVAVHHHIKTVQKAAEWIRLLNPPEVTRFNDKDTFRSRLTEQDPEALAVQAAAVAGNLVVGGSGVAGISVQTAEALHHMGKLTEVGLVKSNSEWKARKVAGPYLIGLGGYMLATGDNSTDLRHTLDKNSPEAVEATMHKEYGATTPHARVASARFARAILAKRNHKRKDNRAKAAWKRVDTVMKDAPWSDRWGVIADE